MNVKDVRKGKKIFLVREKSGYVMAATVLGTRKIDDEGSPTHDCVFANYEYFNEYAGRLIEASFSLRDYNIVPNNYNSHKAFFTPAAACKYARP